LAIKYGYKGSTNKDLKNDRLKESMITLGNIQAVFFVGVVVIVSGGVAFVVEICSKEIVFMLLA